MDLPCIAWHSITVEDNPAEWGRWLILVSCFSCWTWTLLAASLIRIFFRESTATSMAGPFTRTLQLNPVDVTINQSLYVKHRIAKVIRTGGTAWVHSMMLTLLPGDYLWYDALTRHGATSEPIIIQPTTIRGVQPPRQNIVSYSESGSGGGVMWSITRCFPSVLSLSVLALVSAPPLPAWSPQFKAPPVCPHQFKGNNCQITWMLFK